MEHLAQTLTQLFVVLLAAKMGEEILKRIGQPALVGEILGGVLVGPAVLGIYRVTPETELFAEIGVVLLLFQVGVETRIGDLLRVGGTAASVGVMGVILPMGGGLALGAVLGYPIEVSVFLGAALTATSVGITARVLDDLGAMASQSGRVILGAAVIDDVLAMLIMAFASGLAAGSVSAGQLATLVGLAGAFIGIVLLVGTRGAGPPPPLPTHPALAPAPPPPPGG